MTKVVLVLLTVTLSLGLFAQNAEQAGETVRSSWAISAGGSFPLGDFRNSPIDGRTKSGAALSGEFAVGASTAWISSILVSYNPTEPTLFTLDEATVSTGPWWTIWPMTGIAWRTAASPALSLELNAQVGLFLGNSPAVTVTTNGGGNAAVSSDRALAVSAGVGAGATFSDHYAVKIRYLYAKPRYDLTILDTNSLFLTSTERRQQTTSVLVVTLGWAW